MLIIFKMCLLLAIINLIACASLNCAPGIVNYKLRSCSTVTCIQTTSQTTVIDSIVPGVKCKFF